jgi:hypothetical protein
MTRRRSCAEHREALADLAERHEPTQAGAAAIRHVSRCEDCAEMLGELMLTVIALRRMAGEAATAAAPLPDRLSGMLAWPDTAAQPTDTTWTRLRDRIERSRRTAGERAWRWRVNLGGLVASALVVGALVGPGAIHVGGDPEALSGQQLEILSWQIESSYDVDAHAIQPGGVSGELLGSDAVSSRQYPDDLRPPRKEVSPARAMGLLPDVS